MSASSITAYLNTILKLGIFNVLYVFWYRLTIKTGVRQIWFPKKKMQSDSVFFNPCEIKADFQKSWQVKLIEDAERIISGKMRYYAFHWKEIGNPPNWFLNPFNGKSYPNTNLNWTKLPDFHPHVGDIKNVWEASRFEWVVTLARAYAVTGDKKYISTLNEWLLNWSKTNPFNIGPNWKCGQEASIRIINLLNAALILNQYKTPTKVLSDLIYYHLERIDGNILYAISQNNNHGTSEAAGLFIGANWLLNTDRIRYPKAKQFASDGRKWLENRANKLIGDDGSFSQHSVNYHRLMLDTLTIAEFWRIEIDINPFSDEYYYKVQQAISWLFYLTDEKSGNCPNLGANDGSMLLNSHSCKYKDFRPTLQFSNAVFNKTKQYDTGEWDEPLYWYGLDKKHLEKKVQIKESVVLAGGYVVMKAADSWGLLRFPHYKFRPSHNDVFHFDLWTKGQNIMHDSGTFSYNPDSKQSTPKLKSVQYHNTVSFDNKEQMPELSRFLLGKWIEPDYIGAIKAEAEQQSWEGSYTDSEGNNHHRKIEWNSENTWTILDTFKGKFSNAVIGYNLINADYTLKNNTIKCFWGTIEVQNSSQISLFDSITSEHYQDKTPCKRLVIKSNDSKSIITKISIQ